MEGAELGEVQLAEGRVVQGEGSEGRGEEGEVGGGLGDVLGGLEHKRENEVLEGAKGLGGLIDCC